MRRSRSVARGLTNSIELHKMLRNPKKNLLSMGQSMRIAMIGTHKEIYQISVQRSARVGQGSAISCWTHFMSFSNEQKHLVFWNLQSHCMCVWLFYLFHFGYGTTDKWQQSLLIANMSRHNWISQSSFYRQ